MYKFITTNSLIRKSKKRNNTESTDTSYISVFKPRKRKKNNDVEQVEVSQKTQNQFKPVKFAYHDVLNRKRVTVQADTEQRYNELKTALNSRLVSGTIRNLKESR